LWPRKPTLEGLPIEDGTIGAFKSSNTDGSPTFTAIAVTASARLLHFDADGVMVMRTGKGAKNVAEEWHDRKESREVVVVSKGGIVEEPTQ
jgi:hypothetical protein